MCSLLDILAGRKDMSGMGGTVLVNGDRQPKNFKCIMGYVVQVHLLSSIGIVRVVLKIPHQRYILCGHLLLF